MAPIVAQLTDQLDRGCRKKDAIAARRCDQVLWRLGDQGLPVMGTPQQPQAPPTPFGSGQASVPPPFLPPVATAGLEGRGRCNHLRPWAQAFHVQSK